MQDKKVIDTARGIVENSLAIIKQDFAKGNLHAALDEAERLPRKIKDYIKVSDPYSKEEYIAQELSEDEARFIDTWRRLDEDAQQELQKFMKGEIDEAALLGYMKSRQRAGGTL